MVKRIAVTGGGGQIAYSLLFRIASGELFGKNEPIALHILEVPQGLEPLKGVVMELEDCSYPLLKEIKIGTDPVDVFGDVNVGGRQLDGHEEVIGNRGNVVRVDSQQPIAP